MMKANVSVAHCLQQLRIEKQMEKQFNFKIPSKSGTLRLAFPPIPQQAPQCFQLYRANPRGILLMSPVHLLGPQALKNIHTKAQDSCRKLGEAAFANMLQTGRATLDGQSYQYCYYAEIQASQSLAVRSSGWGESQMFALAEILLRLVVAGKENQLYFGSFRPSRIFVTEDGRIKLLPGELTDDQTPAQKYTQQLPLGATITNSGWKYQPPEIYQTDGFLDYKSDLFVVGCLLIQAITGVYPFATKQDLLTNTVAASAYHSLAGIVSFITQKILRPSETHQRAEPEEILECLEIEKSRLIFSTNMHQGLPSQENINSLSLLDNIQQFFAKRVRQTEGWFLYYCENDPKLPDEKYLDKMLRKLATKGEKIDKLLPLIQKYSKMRIKTENGTSMLSSQEEDYSMSVLKLGLLIVGLLRRASSFSGMGEQTLLKIKQQSLNVISKRPQWEFLSSLFKVISFKITLQEKYPLLRGNFHVTAEQFSQGVDLNLLGLLADYCSKIGTYIGRLANKTEGNQSELENAVIIALCDELHDGVSFLIFGVKSLQKDDLTLDAARLSKVYEGICANLANIEKLSSNCEQVSHHQLYSVVTDPYSFQEQIEPLYEPVLTSYEYFYYDQKEYKGLKLPANFSRIYNPDYLQTEKPKRTSIVRPTALNNKNLKPNTNDHPARILVDQPPAMKSVGSKVEAVHISHENKAVCRTERALPEGGDSAGFNSLKIQSEHKKSVGTAQNSTSKKSWQEEFEETFSIDNSADMLSYEWLKRTERIMVEKNLFVKPEIDSKIHMLYEQIVKGLKLNELIQALEKNKKMIVEPTQVLFSKVIGSGSAGEVYIGRYKEETVAVKKVKTTTNPNALKQFEREVLTYIKIKSHPNLVSMVGLTKFNQDYFLLTEFCNGGSLFEVLHKKVKEIELDWKTRLRIALDVALGMSVLHQMSPPVIHRDMKSLNVFMSRTDDGKGWIAKVADFGLSRTPDAGMMTSALGTLHWMAPELLTNKQYSLKVDVYSFAIVLWEICSRRTPYHQHATPMAIVRHVVMEKGRPDKGLINAGCPAGVVGLMEECWMQDPESRPYFPEVIERLEKEINN